MPKGVYERKKRNGTEPAPQALAIVRRPRASPQSKRQAQAMLRMASAQLHVLALTFQQLSDILGVPDQED